MKMSKRRADQICVGLIVAMFAAALWVWPSVPGQIHSDILGQPIGYEPKFVGLLLRPIAALALFVSFELTLKFRRQEFEWSTLEAFFWARFAFVLWMAGVVAEIVTRTHGIDFGMNYIVIPLFLFMVMTSGNVTVRVFRDYAARLNRMGKSGSE
jgi:hypothetical protein